VLDDDDESEDVDVLAAEVLDDSVEPLGLVDPPPESVL
jgi:hypothetical protein